MFWLLPIGILAGLFIICLLLIYKVARIDQALIITGGKKPKVKVAGGGFVIPVIRRHSFFDLCMITVEASGDEIKTTTGVPIIVNWTAQIRPNAVQENELLIAATSFLERGANGIKQDIKLTLDGGVREVVAGLTPEQVLREKDAFGHKIKESVTEEMRNMGFILVSLNIQDVFDSNGYYNNLAAQDMESKRQEAANVTAKAEQAIRQQKAEADKEAQETELKAELTVAEIRRDNDLRKAAMKAETDKAQADADIAGNLQATTRQKELAEEEGHVEVIRQTQRNLAAQKKAEVIATEAEADRKRREIEATAAAIVLEKEAAANANAAKTKAEGQAAAVKMQAEAEAQQIALKGKAEADIVRQRGEAEAGAIKARALAEAEGERALADARAANDGVNFKVTVAEIDAKARVEIATAAANVMGDIGKNARFVSFGGGNGPEKPGNVLFDTLMGIPTLLEKLNVANQTINPEGQDFNASLRALVNALVEPLGVLNKEKSTVVSGSLAPGDEKGYTEPVSDQPGENS